VVVVVVVVVVSSSSSGGSSSISSSSSVLRLLTMGIRSEKRVVRRFRRCANVIQCTYTNLDSTAYCTPRLYGIAYCC